MDQPGHPQADAIRQVYRAVDAEIGDLLETIDDDTTILLMSDHGFGSFRGRIYTNTWLRRNGYLTLRRRSGSLRTFLVRRGFSALSDWA